MADTLSLAKQALLEPAELTESRLQQTLDYILSHQNDAADLYFQAMRYEAWSLEDGIVKDGAFGIDRGVGVRAMSGEKTGFAYSDDILIPALEDAAQAARSITRQGGNQSIQAWQGQLAQRELYHSHDPLPSLSEVDKIALMQRLDAEARRVDPRVKEVNVNLMGRHDVILVAGSEGGYTADVRPMIRCTVSVIVEQNGRREQGYSGGGGRYDYQYLLENDTALTFAREAVRKALVALEAEPAPAGTLPVVLGPGWPGVLLHEAIGHGLEGDFNRRGVSAFSGRIGERVATPACTVVDDGTLEGRRGSLNIDDEGVASQCTVLIENGILKGYMQDRLNARLMGVESTGNGRRESYAHIPMPRMTNTYMLAGEHTQEEIIASVDRGIFAVDFGGGQVDITSGKFVFSASEAYLIENGKVTRPIKGAMLMGNGPDVLTKVSMVGNDLELDKGTGVCGKEGQSIPVCVGQPTLKIDELTVGGTQA